MPKAVILLSGGLDSVTVLALALEQSFDCYTLSLDYGQRHKAELAAAKNIAATMQVQEHKVINLYANIESLQQHDQVKFVICSKLDYQWALDIIKEHKLNECCDILFTPGYEQQDATELADWILQDRAPVRMQIQLHKFLWGDVPGK